MGGRERVGRKREGAGSARKKNPLARLGRLQPWFHRRLGSVERFFPGMPDTRHPFHCARVCVWGAKSHQNLKTKNKPHQTTLFEWAGNEPRTPVFAYGSLIRVPIFPQSNQEAFSTLPHGRDCDNRKAGERS